MEIDEKALEAACRAHAPQWDRMDEDIRVYARQQMAAAILAYKSSRSQSSDARDAVIEECREALFVQIVLAHRAASYDDISEILDALKRPADRKGTTGITPDRGFAGLPDERQPNGARP